MTGWAWLAGMATLAALLATSGRPAGSDTRQLLRSYAPLLPGVIVASAAVLFAGWLPSLTAAQPRWLSALAPVLVVAAFVLVVGRYRRPGRSTSRRSR